MEKIKSCNCKECISSCWQNPGWFGSIQELKGAAKIMGMELKEFAKKYLIREWWNDGVIVPAPRRNFRRMTKEARLLLKWIKPVKNEIDKKYSIGSSKELHSYYEEELRKNGKGFKVATWGHNLMDGFACIFLDKNNKCMIHMSKPMECRVTFSCKKSNFRRSSLVKYWKKHQNFLEELAN